MNYEQKYKEALERAKYALTTDMDNSGHWAVNYIFPELKESEDSENKRISKEITQFLKQNNAWNREWLVWLEKQGKQPADKIDTKFKVGDWIVQENIGVYKVIEICESWYEVVDNKDKHYSIGFDKEYMCHLWTIDDAQEGDVLTCYSDIKGQPIEQTGIIKQYVGRHGGCSNSFKAHFGVDWNNNVVIEGYMGSSNIYPATKEQRELLFSKMKEAGYEWDDKKEELKKIEVISKESEDEKIRKAIISILKGEIRYVSIEDTNKFVAWLEKQGEQKDLIAEIKNRKALLGAEKEKAVSSTDKLSLGARIAMLDELLAWVGKQGEQ